MQLFTHIYQLKLIPPTGLCYTIETENAVDGKPFIKNDKVVKLIERNNYED